MPKYSFVGVDLPPTELRKTKSVTGPRYQRRVSFYRRYFPVSVARVMALRWNISREAVHYSQGIMDGLKILENRIREAMFVRRVDRGRATQIVWRAIREEYEMAGVHIESSGDLFQAWIGDNVSP